MTDIAIRRATAADLPRLGELAGRLVRQHHAVDPARFFLPDDVERGYAVWFERELLNPAAVLLIAESHGVVAGYAYGRVQGRDWSSLLDRHGTLEDILVDEGVRRRGIGRLLLMMMIAELEARGAPLVVLSTMTANHAAQRLFESCGFRPTMVEMTRNRGG